MPDNETVHCTELSKLIDNGTNNNYGKWKTKSYHKLREWGLLKYIEGPHLCPPVIPPLLQPIEHHGLDENGVIATVHVMGNVIEHENTVWAAEPWMAANNQALSCIVAALSGHQLLLIQNATYAKDAWDSLKEIYQPQNSICAASLRWQIIMYRCTPDMNIAKWLINMQNLFSSLYDLELKHMSDRDFTLAILDLMPHDNSWHEFASNLRTKAREADMLNLPLRLSAYITSIHDEHWYHTKDTDQNKPSSSPPESRPKRKHSYPNDPTLLTSSPPPLPSNLR